LEVEGAPTTPVSARDAEYVVVPRAALFEFFGRMALPPWQERGKWIGGNIDCAPIAEEITSWVDANDLSHIYPLGGTQTDGSR
jgi:hypothetical protein